MRQSDCQPKCSKPGQKNCHAYIPDFVKVAEAYGAVGIRISSKKDVIPALKKALAINDRTVVMEFIVEQEENVFADGPRRRGAR